MRKKTRVFSFDDVSVNDYDEAPALLFAADGGESGEGSDDGGI